MPSKIVESVFIIRAEKARTNSKGERGKIAQSNGIIQTDKICRAQEASRVCATTEVPDRSNCLPSTRTSARAFGNLTKNRIVIEANCLIRLLNSSLKHPFISIVNFCFLLSPFR